MSDRPVKISITTAADTSGAEAAQQAIEGVQEASAEASAASQAEAVVQQEQGREIVTGFGGQVEAMERVAEARRAAERDLRAQEEAQRKLNEETEDYEENLQDVVELERKLQREADVVEATRRRDERAGGDEDGLGTAGAAGLGGAAAKLGDLAKKAAIPASIAALTAQGFAAAWSPLKELADDLERLRIASGRGIEDADVRMKAFSETVSDLANPLGAVLDLAVSLKDAVKSRLETFLGFDEVRQSAELAIEMERQLAAALELQEVRKQMARDAAAYSLAFAIQRERQEIDAATAALERQMGVLQARRSLVDAQAARQEAAAIAGGGNSTAVQAEALARRTASDLEALNDEIVRSAQAVERAEAELTSLNNRFVEARESGQAESLEAARLAQAAGEEAFSQAVADHRNTVEVLGIEAEAIKERALAESEQLQQAGGAAITEALQGLAKDLEQTAAEQGGQLSATAQQGFKQIVDIIKDSIPDADQIPQIGQAMALVKASQEGFGREVLTGLSELAASTGVLQNDLRVVKSQIRALSLRRDPRPGP